MAKSRSSDYRYFTSQGQVFRGRDPSVLDRWLYGAGTWGFAAGAQALSQEEQDRLREITPDEALRRIDRPAPDCALHFGARGEDWREVDDAVRDILFLYRDLTDYDGLTEVGETGTFDPWRFLDCTLEYDDEDTAQLLHQGAAV